MNKGMLFATVLSGVALAASAGESPRAPTGSDRQAQAEEGIEIRVAETRKHGKFLADAQGRALYLLEEDERGESSCYEACERVWPPLLTVQGEPEAVVKGVRKDLLGTIKRDDGFAQITYNGHPLYYYVKDEGTQEASGHHVTDAFGEWYLVSPEGEPLQAGAHKHKGKEKENRTRRVSEQKQNTGN